MYYAATRAAGIRSVIAWTDPPAEKASCRGPEIAFAQRASSHWTPASPRLERRSVWLAGSQEVGDDSAVGTLESLQARSAGVLLLGGKSNQTPCARATKVETGVPTIYFSGQPHLRIPSLSRPRLVKCDASIRSKTKRDLSHIVSLIALWVLWFRAEGEGA